MHRIVGDIGPRRKWSSLRTVAFIQVCVCLFANCEQQLVDHITGTLQYGVCSTSTCPIPSRTDLRDQNLITSITEFRLKHVLDDYNIQYHYSNRGISWELDTVRVNCSKTDGIFNCQIPPNDCAYVIYGNVHAVGACSGCSYKRANVDPGTDRLRSSKGLTKMAMTLKGTSDDAVPSFSVRCPVQCLNDSVKIVALVYRCN